MKLGIISHYDNACFNKVKEYGLSFIEVCLHSTEAIEHFLSSEQEIKMSIAETGVAVGSVGIWGLSKILPDGTVDANMLAYEQALVDACERLACGSYVTNCNYNGGRSLLENCNDAVAFLSALLAHARGKNVRVSVYNCDWNNYVYNEDMWKLIHGHLPELYIKFDPSHSIYRGEDYLRVIAKWGSRFSHIHLKGVLKTADGRIDDPPAGLDMCNWGAVLAILYHQGYAYGLSIEPHSTTWKDELGEKGIQYTVDYFKKMIF